MSPVPLSPFGSPVPPGTLKPYRKGQLFLSSQKQVSLSGEFSAVADNPLLEAVSPNDISIGGDYTSRKKKFKWEAAASPCLKKRKDVSG